MELLLSKHPLLTRAFSYKSVEDYVSELIERSDQLNIATGFVSNASIVELTDIIKYHQAHRRQFVIKLLIGMDYIEHFTRLQYQALQELNSRLERDGYGVVMVSKDIPYHGKMYAFEQNGVCDNAFVGSSNLGSFIGTSDELIESDMLFHGLEAVTVNDRINNLFTSLGTNFSDLPPVNEFKSSKFTLLDSNYRVKKHSEDEVAELKAKQMTTDTTDIPLKTDGKSNLNTYFGKGKSKTKFLPRDWYEVEVIVSESVDARKQLDMIHFPIKNEKFTVITDDGYEFDCELQGGNRGKNLRSSGDLRILGKWIKGHMESNGALQLGCPVTPSVLSLFGKKSLRFTRLQSGNWFLEMV